MAQFYDLTPEQVSAARAAVFTNADTVLARHLEIERMRATAENPPEVTERPRLTREEMMRFPAWLAAKRAEDDAITHASASESDGTESIERFPTFREWLAQEICRPTATP